MDWQAITTWLRDMGTAMAPLLRVTLILCLAWILSALLRRTIRVLRERVARRFDDPEAVKRAETLGRVLRHVVGVAVWVLAGMLILGELGVSIAPILGAAGVVGIAVGFGAQSLVKDFFTGLSLLLEDQLRQGDLVQLGQHGGIVEEITLRYVRLRDYEGNVHFVPNGQITTVVNKSRGFSNAVIEVGIAYGDDGDVALGLMQAVGKELRADPAFASRILDDFEPAGIERLDASAVVLRGRIRCAPLEQAVVRREFLRRVKRAFDTHGIEIPFPQVVVHGTTGPVAADSAHSS